MSITGVIYDKLSGIRKVPEFIADLILVKGLGYHKHTYVHEHDTPVEGVTNIEQVVQAERYEDAIPTISHAIDESRNVAILVLPEMKGNRLAPVKVVIRGEGTMQYPTYRCTGCGDRLHLNPVQIANLPFSMQYQAPEYKFVPLQPSLV